MAAAATRSEVMAAWHNLVSDVISRSAFVALHDVELELRVHVLDALLQVQRKGHCQAELLRV